MKIELILLGVIGLVFLVDFIKKSSKNSSIDNAVFQKKTENKITERQLTDDINDLIPQRVKEIVSEGRAMFTLFLILYNTILLLTLIDQGGCAMSCVIETWWADDFYFLTGIEITFFYMFALNFPLIIIGALLKLNFGIPNFLIYVSNRKKNFSLFLISIPLIKVFFHFLLYPIMTKDLLKAGRTSLSIGGATPSEYSQAYKKSFGEHLDLIFTGELWLFIPTTFLMLFVVWFFNDKIKAR
jgi:hypothetical protein